MFSTNTGGFTKQTIANMRSSAMEFAQQWHDREGMMPPTSGGEGIFCSEWVSMGSERIEVEGKEINTNTGSDIKR